MTLSDVPLEIFLLEWDDEKLAALAANDEAQADQAQTEKLALEALGGKDTPAPSHVCTDRVFPPVRVKVENYTKEVPVFYTERPAPAKDSLSEIASQINTAHAAAKAAAKSTLQHAIKCGAFLHDAKARIAHGQWLPWLCDHCPEISERMAQNYMRLHDRRAELKSETGFVFEGTIKSALAQLKKPRAEAPKEPDADKTRQPQESAIAARPKSGPLFDGAAASAVHRALEEFFETFPSIMKSFVNSTPTTDDCDAIHVLVHAAIDKLGALAEETPADHHDSTAYKHAGFRAFCTDDH